jgi:hypothetical protein
MASVGSGGSRDVSKGGGSTTKVGFQRGVPLLYLVFQRGSTLKISYLYPILTKFSDQRRGVIRPPEPPPPPPSDPPMRRGRDKIVNVMHPHPHRAFNVRVKTAFLWYYM